MAWKNSKQLSLADGMVVTHKAITELDEAHELIDWHRIEALLKDIHNKPCGELAYPPLMMFKALLLQSWYDLSDPQLEKQLARDLLFRRFVGLSLSGTVPDHSTLWRFRQELDQRHVKEALLQEINQQLSEHSVYVKHGEISIVDASVIKAQRHRKQTNEKGENTQDPEAGYAVKRSADGKLNTTYGFKAHINVDEDGLIKASAMTAGHVHDSQCFEQLLSGDEAQVYADSAYASGHTDQWLADHHIDNRVLKRAYRNKPLSTREKRFNQRCSRIRCGVERVFGLLKRHCGMGQARYLGIARNHTRLSLMSMMYNIKRGVSLKREMCLQESYA